MRVLESLAIVVAGGMIAGAILYTERIQILTDQAGDYLVHDTWTGDLTGCTIAGLREDPKVSCTEITRY